MGIHVEISIEDIGEELSIHSLSRKRQMMLEEQLKEAAREPKQVSLESKFACSPPICLTAVLPAKAYLRFVSLV